MEHEETFTLTDRLRKVLDEHRDEWYPNNLSLLSLPLLGMASAAAMVFLAAVDENLEHPELEEE